ncbi:MAG: gamma carbonic anhydrase family protein [Pseudomonadota bacterium]
MEVRFQDGPTPRIDPTAWVAPNAVIAGDLSVGPETGLWFGVVARADVNFIRIGARTNIQDLTMVHCTGGGWGTTIGDEVTVGHSAVLHACTLEDRSFIGMQALVMDECVVETGAMLAAGALLPPGKRIPAGELWGGRPARKMRDLSPDALDEFRASADRYVGWLKRYRDA